MARAPGPAIYYHLHLISDSTGETVNAIAKATCAQFDLGRPIEHVFPLVRNVKQLERAMKEIEEAPGPIVATIINPELRARLTDFAEKSSLPISFPLDEFMVSLSDYLGEPPRTSSPAEEMLGERVDPGFAKDVANLLTLLEGCRGHDELAAEGDNRIVLPITTADLSQLRVAADNVLAARSRLKTRSAIRSFIAALQVVLRKMHGSVLSALNFAADVGKPVAHHGRRIVNRAADNSNAALFAVAYRASELLSRAMDLLQKLLRP